VTCPDDAVRRIRARVARHRDPAEPASILSLLQRVCGAAAQTLSASGTAISMMTTDGNHEVGVASDAVSERLDELQFVLGEGPCQEAFDSRRPVLVPDVTTAMTRWPVFAPALRDDHVEAVFAFPLQIGAVRLGVLGVFRDRPGALTSGELVDAFAFVEVTIDAVLDQHERTGTGDGGTDLAEAVNDRASLFQAQGVVMVQLGVGIRESAARIRAHAYAYDRRLGDVARDVVTHRLIFKPDSP
jgi:GAF domain-containing protein/ANTAR domain-containing protein